MKAYISEWKYAPKHYKHHFAYWHLFDYENNLLAVIVERDECFRWDINPVEAICGASNSFSGAKKAVLRRLKKLGFKSITKEKLEATRAIR